jgi:hypothetical protein
LFNKGGDLMRLLMAVTSFGAVMGVVLGAGAAQAASVEIKDAVARVVVIPEARDDIKVEFLTTNPSLPLKVRTQGDRVIVDGDLDRKIRSCHTEGGRISVRVAGLGDIAYADMPQVVIRTPRDVHLGAGGAVFGSVGKSAALELSNAGCGDWTVGNVQGRMKLSQAGSGNTRAGTAGEAALRVAGSGDVFIRDIAGGLDIDVAGSGDVSATAVSGPLDVKIAGSGDVNIGGGKVTAMIVSVAGSGDVDFRGEAASLKAHIAGSGDVRAKSVTGSVTKAVMGSGSVSIG